MNKRFWFDIVKLTPLLGFAGLVLVPDDSRGVILFAVAIILLAVAVAHVIRKVIFPYIDVKVLVEKAKESAMASAVIVFGLMYVLSTVIESLVALLR